jgi:XXXCH domain-containing protein
MGSWKTERELAGSGLPEFLRELAAALESGVAEETFHGLPLRDFRKLLLVAERHGNGLSVKLKAKRADEVHAPRTGGAVNRQGKSPVKAQASREKYRQLKKTMQAEFKAMQADIRAGRLPGAEGVESFLSLADLMGQGEQPVSGATLAEMAQANAAFLEDCQALRRAHAARDATALAEALERLARRKSACHAQFR